MTATPLPRSLALPAFGDLDVSTIHTMPAGRKKIVTHLTCAGNEDRVYERVYREVRAGNQAYFVYPLIEESPVSGQIKHAEGMYRLLKETTFPDLRVGLIHSRQDENDKRRTMACFLAREIDILVATSVVEVGVDVPKATCMVIEQAERFGLSALHQLRGRVGRGDRQSYAFLIYSRSLTEDAVKRLKIMMTEADGFRISEQDLAIRGPGDMLGVKQSGFLQLDIADLARDTDVLLEAYADVNALLDSDPDLEKPENAAVRDLLRTAPPFDDSLPAGGPT